MPLTLLASADVPVFGPQPQAGGELLSAKRATASSSTENAGFPSSAAVDGDPATRWSSAFADPQWITVDLGAIRSISRVVLNWEAAYGRAYQLQTSTDGDIWSAAYSTATGNGGVDDVSFAERGGRYVRMYGSTRGLPYGYSLREFAVFGR
jgi:hypothetical protein